MGYSGAGAGPTGTFRLQLCRAVVGEQGQSCAARTQHPALSMGLMLCPTLCSYSLIPSSNYAIKLCSAIIPNPFSIPVLNKVHLQSI